MSGQRASAGPRPQAPASTLPPRPHQPPPPPPRTCHLASNLSLTSFQPYTPLGTRCPEGNAVAQVRMGPSGLRGGVGGPARARGASQGPLYGAPLPPESHLRVGGGRLCPSCPAQGLLPMLPLAPCRSGHSARQSCGHSLVSPSTTLARSDFPAAQAGVLNVPIFIENGGDRPNKGTALVF